MLICKSEHGLIYTDKKHKKGDDMKHFFSLLCTWLSNHEGFMDYIPLSLAVKIEQNAYILVADDYDYCN